jgi:hypothetical protein
MKILYVLLLILCWCIVPTATTGQIRYALKGGMSVNKIVSDLEPTSSWTPMDPQIRIGYHLGALAIYNVHKNVDVQTGLIYALKGTGHDLKRYYSKALQPSKVDVEGYSRVTYHYLEIPFQGVYRFYRNFQLFGGPYMALGVGGRKKFDYQVEKENSPYIKTHGYIKRTPVFNGVEINPFNKYFNALDFGANFGIGYKLRPITVSAEYSLGMRDLKPRIAGGLKIDTDQLPSPPSTIPSHKLLHRVVHVSLGYSLSRS